MDLPGFLDFANNLIGLAVWACLAALWLWRRASNTAKKSADVRRSGNGNKERDYERAKDRAEFQGVAASD